MSRVLIAGGGPAGLGLAILLRLRGVEVCVFERQAAPCDKACGEGLMPAGVAALQSMGVLAQVSEEDRAPFRGIRYVQEDGSCAEADFALGAGLGVRRTALHAAMLARAEALGAQVHPHTQVLRHERHAQGVRVGTTRGEMEGGFLVAADGLHSPLRRAEGLEGRAAQARRFGMRAHFAVPSWSDRVEVHFGAGVEAYVTPAGRQRVGVAFLWDQRLLHRPSFGALLERFPVLREHLSCAEPDSTVRGAGVLEQRVVHRTRPRFALLGDAAGYVDAITGEGLTLAFHTAHALAELLPDLVGPDASQDPLWRYERHARVAFRRYAALACALRAVAARPVLRRALVGQLRQRPRLFSFALNTLASSSKAALGQEERLERQAAHLHPTLQPKPALLERLTQLSSRQR